MRQEAAAIATLFLNFQFWFFHGNSIALGHSLPVNAACIALFAITIGVLFVTGPAPAIERSGGLFPAIADALGTLPAHAIRLCAIYFLVDWLGRSLAISTGWQLPFILRRDVDGPEKAIAATLLLLFLAYTARHQSMDRFTLRLAAAVLIAASIRVHEGWLNAIPHLGSPGRQIATVDSLIDLALWLAPLGLFTAAHTTKLRTFALPLFASLLITGIIGFATQHSDFAGPKGVVNIASALWGGAAASALPGSMMIAIITTFGAARFGLRELVAAAPTRALFTTTLIAIAALSAWRTREAIAFFWELHSDLPATVLALTAAVLSADALTNPPHQPRQIDWLTTPALLAGLLAPNLPASYATAFLLTLLARRIGNPC